MALAEDGPPLVFERTGKFLRTIGRSGSGPGEFKAASELTVGPRDTVFILDRETGSVTVLGPTFDFVRTAPGAPGAFSFALTGDITSIVVNASVPDPERFGNPYHLLDLKGNYVSSFGEPIGALLPGAMYPQMRWLTPSQNGGFWSLTVMGQHELQHWSSDATLKTRLVRQASWFPLSENPQRSFRPESPRSPINMSIVEDAQGYLWILSLVADARWQEGVRKNERRNTEEHIPLVEVIDYDRSNDTIIEVIDPRTGTVVSSRRFDQMWYRFVGPNVISRFKRKSDGSFVVDVARFALEQTPK